MRLSIFFFFITFITSIVKNFILSSCVLESVELIRVDNNLSVKIFLIIIAIND